MATPLQMLITVSRGQRPNLICALSWLSLRQIDRESTGKASPVTVIEDIDHPRNSAPFSLAPQQVMFTRSLPARRGYVGA
jgi:hypothetical protein